MKYCHKVDDAVACSTDCSQCTVKLVNSSGDEVQFYDEAVAKSTKSPTIEHQG